MTKDRKRIAQRRAAKVAQAKRGRLDRVARSKNRQATTPPTTTITNEMYAFWICHGANFLASDDTSGEWNPLFEGIYHGVVPDADRVVRMILARYRDDSGVAVKAILGWVLSDKRIVSQYKSEIERRILAKTPGVDAETLAMQPYNAVAWEMISRIKDLAVLKDSRHV